MMAAVLPAGANRRNQTASKPGRPGFSDRHPLILGARQRADGAGRAGERDDQMPSIAARRDRDRVEADLEVGRGEIGDQRLEPLYGMVQSNPALDARTAGSEGVERVRSPGVPDLEGEGASS